VRAGWEGGRGESASRHGPRALGDVPPVTGCTMSIWEVILAFVVVVLMLVALLANVLVLMCFLYSADIRKQVPGLFILNLTFCNLLMQGTLTRH